jgi:hypothetical protein
MRTALILSAAFTFLRPSPAAAQGALMKAWVDASNPQAVMGRYSGGGPAVLFDAGVAAQDDYAAGPGWKIKSFVLAVLSPDGRRVAFKAVGENSKAIGIYSLDSGSARILDTDCDAQALVWSPNGKYLAIEDSQGLLNNAVRVMGYDGGASQMEISGDVLSDLGYSAYRFKNEAGSRGQDIWRTQVSSPRWTSERALSFSVRRVHLKALSASNPAPSDQTPAENWGFDVVTKKFAKL